MFKFNDPKLGREVNLSKNFGVLEFKLYKVDFADKFSKTELVGKSLSKKFTKCGFNQGGPNQ